MMAPHPISMGWLDPATARPLTPLPETLWGKVEDSCEAEMMLDPSDVTKVLGIVFRAGPMCFAIDMRKRDLVAIDVTMSKVKHALEAAVERSKA
jgi:hypothetical protein